MTATKTDIANIERLYDAFLKTDFERGRNLLEVGITFEEWARQIGEVGTIAVELIDPEIEVDLSHVAQWPATKIYRGWAGWMDYWRDWLEVWEDFSFTYSGIEAHAAHVVADIELTMRGRGSGIEVTNRHCEVWAMRDGRAVRWSSYDTRRQAMADIGAEPR